MDFFVGAASVAVAGLLGAGGAAWGRSMRRSLVGPDRFDVGYRLVPGDAEPGSKPRWRHGAAVVLRREIRWDDLPPLMIDNVDFDAPRRPHGSEIWSVSPGALVLDGELLSGERVEIAVGERDLPEFRSRFLGEDV